MNKLIFVILLAPQLLLAQKLPYTITGSFDKLQENKFVYLYTQQVDDRTEELTVIPIVNNQFLVHKTIDKKGRLFTSAIIFLGKDDKISVADFNELKKDPEFYINEKVLFVLEDSLHIDFKFPLKQSVVKGGKLNEENNYFNKSLKDGTYLNYVKGHPDSPFSLVALKAIDRVAKYSNQLAEIDILELYNGLSDRIKQSFEGKEFAKKYLK